MHLLDSGYDWDYPGRAAGARQLVHAARQGQGARRLLVAQLVHRVPARPPNASTSGWTWAPPGGVPPRSCRWRDRLDGRPSASARRAAGRSVRRSGSRGGRARSGCRPWRSTAARRCATAPGGSRSTRPRTAPGCRRSHAYLHPILGSRARTWRCAPIAGCPRSCSTTPLRATGVRYQRPDLTGLRHRGRPPRGHRHRRRHRHPEVVDALGNRARPRTCGRSASPVRVDSPGVGANLDDHVEGLVFWEASQPMVTDVDAVVGDRVVHHGRRGQSPSPT